MKRIILITLSLILITTAFLPVATAAKACKVDTECDKSKGEECIDGFCNNPLDLILQRREEAPEIQALPNVTQENLFKTIFKTILGASMILTIAAIVVAAIYYIISQGTEEDLSKAKNIILYLIIGLVIMAAAYGIVSGVIQFDFFKAST